MDDKEKIEFLLRVCLVLSKNLKSNMHPADYEYAYNLQGVISKLESFNLKEYSREEYYLEIMRMNQT